MPSREELIVKANGLYTYQDKLSEVPDGSLSIASNIVIDKDGLFSPRRGYAKLDGNLSGAIKSLHTFTENQYNYLLSYRVDSGDNLLSLYDDNLGSWTDYSSQIEPPNLANSIRTAQTNKNLFLTSNKGVQKLSSISSDLVDAGAPEGLDTEVEDYNTGSGTAIPAPGGAFDQSVGYRIVWGYRDVQNNLVLGPPSQRVVHTVDDTAASTPMDVKLTVAIPTPPVTADWFVQVYRTAVNTGTASDPGDPGDDMGLVLERNPNAVRGSLNGAILAADSTLTLQAGETDFFPESGRITIESEQIDYTGKAGDTLTGLTRGVNGTTAADHADATDVAPDDIFNKEIILIDTTPDELRGTDLYTNATQQGILQANYAPPQCEDLALYQNHMFYANTQSKYSLEVQLLAVDSTGANTSALTIGDTVTINGVTYTGVAGPTPGNNEFVIGSGVSLSDNIDTTARNLVKAINQSTSNSSVWAIYDSGFSDLPGKLRVVERDYGDAVSFTMTSSRRIAWSPDIAANVETATNDSKPNRLYYSKFQQPEAVPLLNYFDVGAANDRILRILPLRSILLIFTTAGVYKLTGATAGSFQVSLLDDTAVLIAPDSLVALNNNAVGLFDQGVAQVSYGSVQILSRPIEGDINAIRGTAGDTLKELAFGISYETDRKYMLSMPTASGSTSGDIVYVYNFFTQSWTTYDLQKTAGIVRPQDDRLYFASTDSVIKERKSFSDADFADPEIDVTVTAVSGTEVTVNAVAGIQVGYQYFQDISAYSIIEAIDPTTNTLTLRDDLGWTTGAAEVRPYIVTEIEWNPITADTPNILKQYSEATLLVNKPITEANISFKTLTSSFYESVVLSDTTSGPWGLFEWGFVPWGGSTTVFRYRTWVPRAKQRDSALVIKLTQNTVFNDFEVSGWSLIYRPISQRVTR